MQSRLILFDIDGTLLWPDKAGRTAIKAALERVYGTFGPIDNMPFNGRTDRFIVHALMQAAGIPDHEITAKFEDLRQVMIEELSTRLNRGDHNVQPCPGAQALINHLAIDPTVLLGLLTGNFAETAALKLQAAGFDPAQFHIGAYGGESAQRSDLPPIAVDRAYQHSAVHFKEKQIVIVGDTPHDVACGREINARSIAVLTGWAKRGDIEAANPDYLFEDLSDTGTIVQAIKSDR